MDDGGEDGATGNRNSEATQQPSHADQASAPPGPGTAPRPGVQSASQEAQLSTPDPAPQATGQTPPPAVQQGAVTLCPSVIAPPASAEPLSIGSLGTLDVRTPEEDALFQECEAAICAGWSWFVQVGLALIQIRDRRLFKNEYRLFEEYYRARWQYQHAQVYNFISATEVYQHLTALPNLPLPDHESLVRPLFKLSAGEAQLAWQTTVANSNGHRITARMVKSVVRALGLRPAAAGDTAAPDPEATPQARYQRRHAIKEGFNELLALLLKRSEHNLLIEKVQLLQRQVEALLGVKKKRR